MGLVSRDPVLTPPIVCVVCCGRVLDTHDRLSVCISPRHCRRVLAAASLPRTPSCPPWVQSRDCERTSGQLTTRSRRDQDRYNHRKQA